MAKCCGSSSKAHVPFFISGQSLKVLSTLLHVVFNHRTILLSFPSSVKCMLASSHSKCYYSPIAMVGNLCSVGLIRPPNLAHEALSTRPCTTVLHLPPPMTHCSMCVLQATPHLCQALCSKALCVHPALPYFSFALNPDEMVGVQHWYLSVLMDWMRVYKQC